MKCRCINFNFSVSTRWTYWKTFDALNIFKSKIIIMYVSLYDLDTCRFAVKLQTIWYGKRKMLKLLLRATKKETQTIPTYLRRAIIRKPHVIKGNIICMHFLLNFSYLNFIASQHLVWKLLVSKLAENCFTVIYI